MKFNWHPSKELLLKEFGRPSFEEVVDAILNDRVIAEEENPRYPEQKILVVQLPKQTHLCAVPCTENEDTLFFHTVFPSRQLTKKYQRRKKT